MLTVRLKYYLAQAVTIVMMMVAINNDDCGNFNTVIPSY